MQVTGIFRAVPHRANPRMRSVKSIYKTYIGRYFSVFVMLICKPNTLGTSYLQLVHKHNHLL